MKILIFIETLKKILESNIPFTKNKEQTFSIDAISQYKKRYEKMKANHALEQGFGTPPCLFPNLNASVLSQYGSIFRFIPPQVVGGLVRPATPLFLPPTCHRQAQGGNPNAVPVPMVKRPRALPFVRQRLPRPTWQAASHADFASDRLRHHRH